jgi:hypothetical protein
VDKSSIIVIKADFAQTNWRIRLKLAGLTPYTHSAKIKTLKTTTVIFPRELV